MDLGSEAATASKVYEAVSQLNGSKYPSSGMSQLQGAHCGHKRAVWLPSTPALRHSAGRGLGLTTLIKQYRAFALLGVTCYAEPCLRSMKVPRPYDGLQPHSRSPSGICADRLKAAMSLVISRGYRACCWSSRGAEDCEISVGRVFVGEKFELRMSTNGSPAQSMQEIADPMWKKYYAAQLYSQ